jgi:DHA1 family tetracycline resistance protein-like MFS transporter
MTRENDDEPAMETTHEFDHFRRNIFILLVMDVLTVGMTVHVIPRVITEMTSNDISAASGFFGLLSSGSSLLHLLTSPLVGTLSDQYGRKRLIQYSLAGNTIGYFILYLSVQHLNATGLLFILCARICTGFTGHLKMLCYTYMSDVIDPSKRAQGFGLLGVAFGVGFLIGPSLGGIIGSYDLSTPFLVSCGVQLSMMLFVHLFLSESLKKHEKKDYDIENHVQTSLWQSMNPWNSLRILFRARLVFLLALAIFIADLAQTGNHAVFVHYTSHRYGWKTFETGLYLTIMGGCAIFTQGVLIHYMIPKFGDVGCIYIGMATSMINQGIIAVADEGWMIYYLIPFISIASIGPLAIRSEMTRQVKEKHLHGSLQGSLSSLQKLSKVIGPLITTNLFRWVMHSEYKESLQGIPFLMCSLMYVLVLVVVRICFSSVEHVN